MQRVIHQLIHKTKSVTSFQPSTTDDIHFDFNITGAKAKNITRMLGQTNKINEKVEIFIQAQYFLGLQFLK